MKHPQNWCLFGCLILAGLLAWACGDGSDGSSLREAAGGRAGSGGDLSSAGAGAALAGAGPMAGVAGSSALACKTADATAIPARAVVSEGVVENAPTPVFVQDLFDSFRAHCGACHVEASSGGLKVSAGNFAVTIDQRVVDRILATDRAKLMPPAAAGGKLASERTAEDPVLLFVERLKRWIAAGRPNDVFYVENTAQPQPANQAGYRMTSSTAEAMTNIGNCVPDRSEVATEVSRMVELDEKFAKMVRLPPGSGSILERIGLPEHLADTDLDTFEAAALAKRGIVAYVPAYPLWTDDAGKLRHVRVPRGTSIRYIAETNQFEFPENTRFYKTFFREVIEADGAKRNRKVETRVIVTRPDVTQSDGSVSQTALFGTYVWNEDESDAVLLTDPLRNGEPFRDRLVTLITDEAKASQIRAQNPSNLSYALETANAVRRYAIPGRDRCLHCHMGSPSQSFVLGFLPVQLHHRPLGEGGRIEYSGPDELTQLKRLIDYGIVTGLPQSETEWPLLENSQGSRKPRNAHELTAQGYLLGNCAHCHNPRGFASVENPVLKQDFDLLPSAIGGIFEFPLERTSQRIMRGRGGSIAIPYLTPSLVDYPVDDDLEHVFWKPKADISGQWWPGLAFETDAEALGLPANTGIPQGIVFAPWRSLIYRNVDTPFTYSDNFALFPHMPMDSPGNDCRAHRILGDWMVSIPAVRKHPEVWEYATPIKATGSCNNLGTMICDQEAQPYVEVKPGDAGYDEAQAQAQQRLNLFHSGLPDWLSPWPGLTVSRYDYCPENADIVDRSVGRGASTCNPKVIPESGRVVKTEGTSTSLIMPDLGIPLRTHFVVADLTDTPGEYEPRRSDWTSVLMNQAFPSLTGADCKQAMDRQGLEKRVVKMLAEVKIGDRLRQYALAAIPMGLWKNKAQCDLSGIRTIASYSGDERPLWMDRIGESHATDAVYSERPGAAVFNMICINCHGQKADSRGRMAENLLTMTGGTVRVANLRDGLFGPASTPGANMQRVFGAAAQSSGAAAEDLAARYLSWMALGGTLARIPPSILNIVGNTQVLGAPRNAAAFQSITSDSANMLATAQELCRHVLPWQPGNSVVDFDITKGSFDLDHSALIASNGDAELWMRLCSIDNPTPIRTLTAADWRENPARFRIQTFSGLYRAEGYPADTPVGDHRGRVQASLTVDNLIPWCIVKPSDPAQVVLAEAFAQSNAVAGRPLPLCPDSLLVATNMIRQDPMRTTDERGLEDWATRGAINAGIAVFLYLEQIGKGEIVSQPSHDRCELLTK